MQNYERVRLFKSDFLEWFSVVHPCVPAMLGIPILFYFYTHFNQVNFLSLIFIFFGILIWTLVEYLLHRFIFHLPINTKWAKKIKHTIHGIHHKDPHDPLRLVAPPVMSITLGSFFLYLFYQWFPGAIFFNVSFGFITGYLFYDYLHWLLHHSKSKHKYMYYLRRNHALHHYSNNRQRFGVTSPLWDFIFHTL
ncbi:MAG: sterol desaturase family protein [Legionella sp.]|uniref:sterol desaturase family protein n=1 Tax=Legionella sp. TaxID=459 RepID=UPI0028467B4E|nr:sterol desaturase family protein [Legionella sp.]